MISITVIFILLIAHFVADFLCQSDWMAVNKSRNNEALFAHTGLYTFVMLITAIFLFPNWELNNSEAASDIFLFGLVTLMAHTITDAITSRWTAKLWKEEKRHWFFVIIGFDQLLHYTQLILTYQLLK